MLLNLNHAGTAADVAPCADDFSIVDFPPDEKWHFCTDK
jgi:hypothetical protein